MRRLALLGATCIALAIAAAACGDTPVQPRGVAGSELAASFATSSTSLVCENAVYPTSLCYPTKRPHLCAALRHGTPPVAAMTDSVGTRSATETFVKNTSTGGSRETVTIPREGYPNYPTKLYFNISATQISQICASTPDLGPVPTA
jgi:hypothetical protein